MKSPKPTRDMQAAGQNRNLVEVRQVSKTFKNDLFKKPFLAVDNLSLTFLEGRCTGLLGHNGAGKTTSIRMLLGLIFPDRGEILFQGEPLNIHHKRMIGYMPEVNKLPLNLTCEEILRFTLALRRPLPPPLHQKSQEHLIDEKLLDLGLTAQKSKKVKKLSKGLARRLAFAQATIHRPQFLILDEPTSGLDPAATKLLEHLIIAEKARGTTILLCTHELSHLSSLCDEFHILKHGQLALTTVTANAPAPLPQSTQRSITPRVQLTVILDPTRNFPKPEEIQALGLPPWSHCEERPLLSERINQRKSVALQLEFPEKSSGQKWLHYLLNRGFFVLDYRFGIHLRDDELRELYEKTF